MRIGRTLPPAATPISIREIVFGVRGICRGEQELDRFRSELKEHFGVKHCFLVSSGKAAVTLILLALKHLCPSRDEVLIPAFTCYSVPSSIVRAGLKIRLCDLHPDGLDFDFMRLSAMLSDVCPSWEAHTALGDRDAPCDGSGAADRIRNSTKRLLAVVPTHLFGFAADVPRLRKLIQDPGVTVVEDAAQAMGETSEGTKLGTLGDVSFFSLGRGKAFGTVDGGIILTNRDDIGETLKHLVGPLSSYSLLKVLCFCCKTVLLALFLQPRLFWIPRSLSFLKLGETRFEPNFPILKLSAFQAGLAHNWLDKLEKLRDDRKKKVNRWIAILETTKRHAAQVLGGQSLGLVRFPLRVSDVKKRDSLLRESAERGLAIMPVYPTSISMIPELTDKMGSEPFPVAEGCARELVTLPTHCYLTENDVTNLSALISRVLA